MTLNELITLFPPAMSVADRALLVGPGAIRALLHRSVSECRVFILVLSGHLTVLAGHRKVVIEQGAFVDMLVWAPVTFVDFSEDIEAWCLLPSYLFTNESLNGLKPADSESFKDRLEVPVLALDGAESRILARRLEMLSDALADFDNYYRTALCQTYFRSFMLEAGNIVQHKKHLQEPSERVDSRQDIILRSFLKLVWHYYKSEHNVDFYARRLNISSKHLSRVVKERLGKTPYAVVRDEIIQQSCELLKTSKKTVQDIAAELHFSETPAFCKFFKKHCGVSPSVYRSGKPTDALGD